jgi:tripartite-type tricarboxylate transporter receptor subunit TctC
MRAFNLLILPVVLLLSSQAIAQTAYPDRPIKMIVPLAAASAVDVAARIVTQKMADNMGQQFVILNLPEHRAFSYTRAGRQYSPSRAKTAAGPVSK